MKSSRAFTLIELLVSIAIVALLTGIVMTSLAPSKGKARDAKRISDIGNIQLTLALYFDRCKEYPTTLTLDSSAQTPKNGCPPGIWLGSFISTIPTPPAPSTVYDYSYKSSGGAVSDYVLHITLENYNEVIKDGLSGAYNSGWTVGSGSAITSCTNTSPGKDYCLGPK